MKYGKKLVLFSLIAMNFIDQPTPPVVIEQGTLTGLVSEDGKILEYIGIPYGVFNNSNRFQEPYPPPKWKGILKATEESFCPQYFLFKTWGVEDCLKVNVYVPVKAKKPTPVMVFVHGGGFIFGSGGKFLYGPEFLVQKNIILVTLNHRLDLLGALCLGIKEAPGNTALRDQIAALRWVKNNIAVFGGDPDNVTIFGQSAGGVAVSLLHASKATTGLFNKVIVQSGTSTANWAVNIKPVWVASLIAKELGYNTEDPHELYEIFSQLPYETFLGVKPKKPLEKFFDTQILHLPCVEKDIPGVKPVLDDIPYNLIRKYPKNIPIIFSTLNREGLFMLHEETEEKLDEKTHLYLFASDLVFSNDEEAAATANRVREFYFGKKERLSMAMKDNITDYCTELYFEIPAILEAEALLEDGDVPVYNLMFEYSGERNLMKYTFNYLDERGACHGDDLLYLFNGRTWIIPLNERDKQIIDWMTELYTNFAKFGNPTPPGSNIPVKWEPSKKGNMKFLYIDDKLRIGPMPNPKGYQLWKDIYQKHRRKDSTYYMPESKLSRRV